MKLAIYDLRTKLNKCVKNLFQIQNRLAVTANQTSGQSRQSGNKTVLRNLAASSQELGCQFSGSWLPVLWNLAASSLELGCKFT